MTKIKICGLKTLSDIEAVNGIKPDYIGFVFWPESKRHISAAEAAVLKAKLDPEIKAVGVFLDEDPEKTAEIANSGIIDIIQLHGHEDSAYIKKLKSRTRLPVIKAVILKDRPDSSESPDDLLRVSGADYILLDSGAGSGRRISPVRLKEISGSFFLAGGLSPDNIEEIVREYRPYAVDVSSGVESGGSKDPVKMRDFVNKVRLAGKE